MSQSSVETMTIRADMSGTVPSKLAQIEDFDLEVPLSDQTVTFHNDTVIPATRAELKNVYLDLTKSIRDIWENSLEENGLDPGSYEFLSVLRHPSASLIRGIIRCRNHLASNAEAPDSLLLRGGTRLIRPKDGGIIPIVAWQISIPDASATGSKFLASSNKFTQDLMEFPPPGEETSQPQVETADTDVDMLSKDDSSDVDMLSEDELRVLTFVRSATRQSGSYKLGTEVKNRGDKEFSMGLGMPISGTASEMPALAEKVWKDTLTYEHLYNNNRDYWFKRDRSAGEEMVETLQAGALKSLRAQVDSMGSDKNEPHVLYTGFAGQSKNRSVWSGYCGWQLERDGAIIATSLDHNDIHFATIGPPQKEKYKAKLREAYMKKKQGPTEGEASGDQTMEDVFDDE